MNCRRIPIHALLVLALAHVCRMGYGEENANKASVVELDRNTSVTSGAPDELPANSNPCVACSGARARMPNGLWRGKRKQGLCRRTRSQYIRNVRSTR